MPTPALLALADGTLFHGRAVGSSGTTTGEVVFNTAMAGYQEILTDPSYAQQIVTLTVPHVGNTGCNPVDVESRSAQVAGLVVRDVPRLTSNWRSTESLPQYLQRQHIVAIADIDTRKLTRILRDKGAQHGCIIAGDAVDAEDAVASAQGFPGLHGMDLAKVVGISKSEPWRSGGYDLDAQAFRAPQTRYRVITYDFGVKDSILRLLTEQGCDVTVVPAQTPAADVLQMHPDGVCLSNGPGDPAACDYAIRATGAFLDAKVPLFGICLGHQLMALALGGKTLKMPFGHHGANHPVKDLDDGRVLITSQNHGFAVDPTTLPPNTRVTHVSLFDGSLQGFALTDRPAFCFQGHPEASPGPHDIRYLFARFAKMMREQGAATTRRDSGLRTRTRDSGLGTREKRREHLAFPGVGGLEAFDVVDKKRVSIHGHASTGRALRPELANAALRRFNSFQHRRGKRAEFHAGLCTLCFDGAWLVG